MSADRRPLPRVTASVARVVRSPHLGRNPRRTVVAIAYALAIVALFALRYAGRVLTVDGVPIETHVTAFDSLSALLIAAATLSITAVPIAYALWNGGPPLSFTLPLVPVLLGELIAGRYVLGLDWVVALTVGATAAILARYATDAREAGTARPWRETAVGENELLLLTAGFALAAATTASFLRAASTTVRTAYAPYAVLFAVAIGPLCGYWCGWRRRSASADATPSVREVDGREADDRGANDSD